MLTQRLIAPLFAAALAGCTGSATVEVDPDPIPGASLTVVNDSDFVIYEVYLTEVDNPDWGPNLLRGDVLYPDEELVLGVPCDYYDALLIDEDGVDCEIYDIDLCLNDAVWVIRNNTCTIWEAEAKKRAAEAQAQATTESASLNL